MTLIEDKDTKIYPCTKCGVMRSKNQGGTVFTVCDECWDASIRAQLKEGNRIAREEVQRRGVKLHPRIAASRLKRALTGKGD